MNILIEITVLPQLHTDGSERGRKATEFKTNNDYDDKQETEEHVIAQHYHQLIFIIIITIIADEKKSHWIHMFCYHTFNEHHEPDNAAHTYTQTHSARI